jgi:hypothetical protein
MSKIRPIQLRDRPDPRPKTIVKMLLSECEEQNRFDIQREIEYIQQTSIGYDGQVDIDFVLRFATPLKYIKCDVVLKPLSTPMPGSGKRVG